LRVPSGKIKAKQKALVEFDFCPAILACIVGMICGLFTPLSIVAQQQRPDKSPKDSPVSVNFVGCRSDGQAGPADAPNGVSLRLRTSPEVARAVAYYKSSQDVGVLAPIGWHCLGVYGSGGNALLVAPDPIEASTLSSLRNFSGPAIVLRRRYGEGIGAFDVAEVIARVFPAYGAMVTAIRKSFDLEPDYFPSGPYPTDLLKYRGPSVVEYRTPPQTDGLGTGWWLNKNDDSVDGVAMLVGATPDLLQLSVRLPDGKSRLAEAIIGHLEQETASGDGIKR
jgi:hypothetical protein